MEKNHHGYFEYRDGLRKVHGNVSSCCSRMNEPSPRPSCVKANFETDLKFAKELSVDGSAAADELDDFEAVAGSDPRFGPFGAREDFEVAFDGDAAGIEAQIAEKIGDSGVRLCGAGLSVYGDGDG
jgi:hypothetical protein